jgi:transcriptional regulator with XRE-family HTH domain
MPENKTPEELEMTLGRQLRDLRLRQNIDQRKLADQAGVALNAVKNLEGGKGATVSSFIKILRALGRTEWLHSLSPEVSISPLQMLKAKTVRQRAHGRKGAGNV